MNQRRSNASSLLQKASSQLYGGKKTPASKSQGRQYMEDSDEEIDKYLSGLGKGTVKKGNKNLMSLDDISISSSDNSIAPAKNAGKIDSGSGNKFLKKSAAKAPASETENMTSSKFLKKPSTVSSGGIQAHGHGVGTMSSALSKVANLTNKYLKKDTTPKSSKIMQLSDSDLDLDMSQDSDVIADVQAMKAASLSRTTTKPIVKQQTGNRFMKNSKTVVDDSDEDQVGSGSRFLKKKVPAEVNKTYAAARDLSVQSDSIASESDSSFKQGKSFLKKGQNDKVKPSLGNLGIGPKTSTPNKTTAKLQRSVALDTDEEDLADFIEGLSPSSVSDVVTNSHRENIVDVVSDSEPESFDKGKNFMKTKAAVPVMESSDNDVSEPIVTQSVSSVDSLKGRTVQLMNLDSLKLDYSDDVKQDSYSDVNSVSEVESVASVISSEDDQKPGVLGQFGLSTLDDLEMADSSPPAQQTSNQKFRGKTEQKKSHKNNVSAPAGLFDKLGLSTLDDLEPAEESSSRQASPTTKLKDVDDIYESDFESAPIESARPDSVATIATISEVQTASPTKSYYSEDFEDFSKAESVSSSRSRSPSRSSSVETVKSIQDSVSEKTEVESQSASYSKDFSTASKSSQSYTSSSRTSSKSSESSYSSYSKSSLTKPSQAKSKKPSSKTVEVQTGDDLGIAYSWNTAYSGMAKGGPQIGLGYTDPTPVATHMISADALEAMTAYSPSVLALNDMLRQQINLTRNFMDTQQRAYQSSLESIQPSYQYTTLEDTKRYIKQKRKPRLTFKQALKQVKAEMNGNL